MSRARFVDIREAESTTLREALARYRREVSDFKKGAAQEGVRIKAWIKDPLTEKSLAALRSSDLAAWRDARLGEGLSPATVRLNLAIISHLYTVAIKEWGIEGVANPCSSLRMPAGSKSRDRRPTVDELKRVMIAAREIHPEMPIIIEFAAVTAMRRSEIAGLRREHIRGKVAYLEDTKNGERRSVPLSNRARELLASLPKRIDGRVFSLAPHSISQYFIRARKEAGVVDLRLHDLRHEATSRLFEMGLSVMEAAAISGHKTLSQLKRYTHLSPDDLADKLG